MDQSRLNKAIEHVLGEEEALSLPGYLLGIKLPELMQQGAVALNFSTTEEIATQLEALAERSKKLADTLRL